MNQNQIEHKTDQQWYETIKNLTKQSEQEVIETLEFIFDEIKIRVDECQRIIQKSWFSGILFFKPKIVPKTQTMFQLLHYLRIIKKLKELKEELSEMIQRNNTTKLLSSNWYDKIRNTLESIERNNFKNVVISIIWIDSDNYSHSTEYILNNDIELPSSSSSSSEDDEE